MDQNGINSFTISTDYHKAKVMQEWNTNNVREGEPRERVRVTRGDRNAEATKDVKGHNFEWIMNRELATEFLDLDRGTFF